MFCTRTFQLADGVIPGQDRPKPFRSDRMLLCWRARDTLTVSVLVPNSAPDYEQTAAHAVERGLGARAMTFPSPWSRQSDAHTCLPRATWLGDWLPLSAGGGVEALNE